MGTWKYALSTSKLSMNQFLRSDDGLEHVKIFVGRLAIDRCLVEAAEGMHDALLALAGRRVNSRPGEEVFAPRSKEGLDTPSTKLTWSLETRCGW